MGSRWVIYRHLRMTGESQTEMWGFDAEFPRCRAATGVPGSVYGGGKLEYISFGGLAPEQTIVITFVRHSHLHGGGVFTVSAYDRRRNQRKNLQMYVLCGQCGDRTQDLRVISTTL